MLKPQKHDGGKREGLRGQGISHWRIQEGEIAKEMGGIDTIPKKKEKSAKGGNRNQIGSETRDESTLIVVTRAISRGKRLREGKREPPQIIL